MEQFIDMPTAHCLIDGGEECQQDEKGPVAQGEPGEEQNYSFQGEETKEGLSATLNLTQMQNSSPYFVTLCLPRF